MNNKKLLIGVWAFFGIIFLYTFLAGSCVFGHSWEKPTCLKPQTCSKCGKTTGTALGHEFGEATCEHGPKCSRCGTVVGEALEHQLSGATCTEAPKCELCEKNVGDALGHDIEYNNIIKAATCVDDGEASGVCKRCGETLNDKIPATGEHTYIWDKDIPACIGGEHIGKCTVCGKEIIESVEKTGEHNFGEWMIENTFEDQGIRFNQATRTCKDCGYKEKDQQLVYLNEEKGKIISQMNINVTNIESWPGDDWHYINVSIVNNSDKVITEINFRVEFYDADDNCIFTTSDACVNTIYPNQSTTTNSSGTFSGNYSRYKIYITNIKYK